MPRKRKTVKVGDWVTIVEPKLFIRCGYPLTPDMVEEQVREEYKDVLKPLGEKLGLPAFGSKTEVETYGKILGILCYQYVADQSFGGRERKIFEEEPDEKYRGMTVQVHEIKRVVTGTYIPASCSGGYDPFDYEPAYLSDQKHHTILGFVPRGSMFSEYLYIRKEHVTWIEQ